MSEGHAIATALYSAEHSVESLVAYDDLHHPNHRYRYAMTLSAHDEAGNPRWLGLRWDGRWETVRAIDMRTGDTVRHRTTSRVGTVAGFGQRHGVTVAFGPASEVIPAMDLIVMSTAGEVKP